MICALDVHYLDVGARAAAVAFHAWPDAVAAHEQSVQVDSVAPYEPGAFYKRELPPLVAALTALGAAGVTPSLVIVDAYVVLDAGRAGLGRHVHDATGLPVVGVAKTAFKSAPATEVLRGASKAPLYVSAVGMSAETAADAVRAMHGAHRIPTLLARVDAIARAR